MDNDHFWIREGLGTIHWWDLGTIDRWDLGTINRWDLGTISRWDFGTISNNSMWDFWTIHLWDLGTICSRSGTQGPLISISETWLLLLALEGSLQ
jgi:hypothetical protein